MKSMRKKKKKKENNGPEIRYQFVTFISLCDRFLAAYRRKREQQLTTPLRTPLQGVRMLNQFSPSRIGSSQIFYEQSCSTIG